MQIMPTTSKSLMSLTDTYFLGADFSGSAGDSFAEALSRQQEARDAVASGESHSVEVALDAIPQVTPLEQAPYNLTSDNGVTYTADEVFFTQTELKELEEDLRKEGAPAESLEELSKLAEQPDGSSLGEVMAALQNMRDYPTLSDTERNTLKALSNKIDPSGDLYSDIRGYLNNRNGEAALDAMVKAMDNLNGNSTMFTAKEMGVLAKSMGLSDESTQQLLSQFGNKTSINLTKEGLSSFLTPAKSEFSVDSARKEKLNAALEKTLGPLLQEARDRMEAEKSAFELSTRKSEHKKVYIEQTVMENVHNNLEGARGSQMEDLQAKLRGDGLNDVAKDATQNLKEDTQAPKDGLGKDVLGKDASTKEQSQEFSRDFSEGKNDQRQDAWGQLLDKTTVRTESAAAASASKNITTPVIGIGGVAATSAQLAQNLANTQAQAQKAHLASQAAQQVEKALLTAARDGSKSLELQLHPAELGTLNITLTARNGEVSAIIRSERSETAEALQKQMEQIRAQLEDQGVKVDKIEVRQGGQENSAHYDSFTDQQQSKARQEENAQKELMERLRNLGKVRNDNTNINGTTLERNMQGMSSSAGNAAQSLYIVA